jgi:hypothetical protein
MDALDPSLFGQRGFPGDSGLQLPHAGALQAALQAQLQGQRASAFNPVAQPYRSEPQQPQPVAPAQLFSQLLGNPVALAQLQGIQDVGQPEAKPTRSRGRAASGGAGGQAPNGGTSVSYASRHQQVIAPLGCWPGKASSDLLDHCCGRRYLSASGCRQARA